MTRNLKLFTLFSLAWSFPFFAILNWGLENPDKRGPLILLASLIYGIGFSIVGHKLGKGDEQRKVRYDLGFRYGMVSTSASLAVGALWVMFWQTGYWWFVFIYLVIFTLICLVHARVSRNNIKGVPKDKLFK